MAHNLALIGGEELSDAFQVIHAGLAAECRGKLRVAFLPTPAANDGIETVDYWCPLAREKLSFIGAIVDTPRVIDRESADDPRHTELVAQADWVYLVAGMHMWPFPFCRAQE
jgi:hypothetical protein